MHYYLGSNVFANTNTKITDQHSHFFVICTTQTEMKNSSKSHGFFHENSADIELSFHFISFHNRAILHPIAPYYCSIKFQLSKSSLQNEQWIWFFYWLNLIRLYHGTALKQIPFVTLKIHNVMLNSANRRHYLVSTLRTFVWKIGCKITNLHKPFLAIRFTALMHKVFVG